MQDLIPSFKSYGPGERVDRRKKVMPLFQRRLVHCQDFLQSEFPGPVGAKPLLLLEFLLGLSENPGDLVPKWAEKCQDSLHFLTQPPACR